MARVGGVVSETSFKFFVQFVGWTAVYCIFNLIVAAYFLAEYRRKVSKHPLFRHPIQTPRMLWEKPQGHTRSRLSFQESLFQRPHTIRLIRTLCRPTLSMFTGWSLSACRSSCTVACMMLTDEPLGVLFSAYSPSV